MRDTKSGQLIALIRDQYRGAAVVAPGMPLVTDVIDALENEAAGARVEAATLRQQNAQLREALVECSFYLPRYVPAGATEDNHHAVKAIRLTHEALAAVAVVETPEGPQ